LNVGGQCESFAGGFERVSALRIIIPRADLEKFGVAESIFGHRRHADDEAAVKGVVWINS
jgi:hypothetical protein